MSALDRRGDEMTSGRRPRSAPLIPAGGSRGTAKKNALADSRDDPTVAATVRCASSCRGHVALFLAAPTDHRATAPADDRNDLGDSR